MPTKVVHLTSVHGAFDVRIFHKECKTLAAAGYDVTLIAPHDHDEQRDGVTIRAVPMPSNRRERMTRTVLAVYRAALRENGDIYHFHDPELMVIGSMLQMRGKCVIYDSHEDLPATILAKQWIAHPLRKGLSNAARLFERLAARRYGGIVTTDAVICQRFLASNQEVCMVQNYPLLDEFGSIHSVRDRFTSGSIVNFGGVRSGRSVKTIIEAMALIPTNQRPTLILGGAANESELSQVAALPGWNATRYVGEIPRHTMVELMGLAALAIVMYAPQPNHLEVRSNRLFEALAAGLPVLTSNFPRWREFVEGNGCGLTADPTSPESIAEAITRILSRPEESARMGENARRVVQTYSWGFEGRKLLDFYSRLRPQHTHGTQVGRVATTIGAEFK